MSTLTGTANSDLLSGTTDNDLINGLAGDDTLDGGAGNDTVYGGDGNDTLISDITSGDKQLLGGNGEDFYFVNSPLVLVVELAGEGIDTVAARVNYQLPQNVEVLYLESGALIGHGNALDNTLFGNAGNNSLYGLDGDDDMLGDGGADWLAGGAGNDTLVGDTAPSEFDETFPAPGNDSLFGGDGDDTLYGADRNDLLGGGNGNDLLVGDAYHSECIHGRDALTGGAGKDTLIGQGAADTLNGSSGADVLQGDGGNDSLIGGSGKDTLTGGMGADRFVFDVALSATNIDTLTDFNSGNDILVLDVTVFAALSAGVLPASAFVVGPAALDADDRIVFQRAAGKLYYDADGDGAGAAVQFAQLTAGSQLVASDFLLLA